MMFILKTDFVLSSHLYTIKGAKESISSLAARYDNPICRAGPPGYKGWRIRFLGSLNVYKYGLCLFQAWLVLPPKASL